MHCARCFGPLRPFLSTLALGLLGASVALAEQAPDFAFQWGYSGIVPGQFDRPGAVAVDAAGRVYVNDRHNHRLQVFQRDGQFLREWGLRGDAPEDFFSPAGIAIAPDGTVVICQQFGGKVQKFSPSGTLIWVRTMRGVTGVAVDSGGDIYVVSPDLLLIRKLSSAGTQVASYRADSGTLELPLDIAVAGNRVYLADTRRKQILVLDTDLQYVTAWPMVNVDGKHIAPEGLDVDPDGNIYVTARGRYNVHKLSPQGEVLWRFGPNTEGADGFSSATDVAIGPLGDIYVTDWYRNHVKMFGTRLPSDNPPPGPPSPEPIPDPPPLPEPGHEAAILLHLQERDGAAECIELFSTDEIVTGGIASAEGRSYSVYLLATPNTIDGNLSESGLTGLQAGIEYRSLNTPGSITVDGFTRCSVLDFPMTEWPATRSGNTLTWPKAQCQVRELVVLGVFEVTVHGDALMRVIPYPLTKKAKLADCSGAEQSLNLTLPGSQLGWVGIGDAVHHGVSGGCNPTLRPCDENVTPVETVTWGRLKAGGR